MSVADISTPRSMAEYSRSAAADSLTKLTILGGSVVGRSTSELDGRDIHLRPTTELDDKEIQTYKAGAGPASPVTEKLGIYKLQGTEVARGKGRAAEPDQAPYTVGALPFHDRRREGNNSPPSTSISTIGTTVGHDERADPNTVSCHAHASWSTAVLSSCSAMLLNLGA